MPRLHQLLPDHQMLEEARQHLNMAVSPVPSDPWNSEDRLDDDSIDEDDHDEYDPRTRPERDTPFDFEAILNSMTSKPSQPPRYVIHHEVHCSGRRTDGHDHSAHPKNATYTDVPRLFARDSRASQLRGKEQVHDLNTYQHQNEDVCIIVCKRYSCEQYHDTYHEIFIKYPIPSWTKSMGPYDARPWFYFLTDDAPEAVSDSEYIYLSSDRLKRTLPILGDSLALSELDGPLLEKLESPYDYFYHYHAAIRSASEQFSLQDQELIGMLLDYIIESQQKNFDDADAMLGTGYVSRAHFGKLFKTSDTAVMNETGGPRAYQIESIRILTNYAISLSCWTWEFDGQFYKTKHSITVACPSGPHGVHITTLAAWPLRLAKPEVQDALSKRGAMFWTLRRRRLVHYDAPNIDTFEMRTNNPKYMVDMSAYRTVHSEKVSEPDPDRENLDPLLMQSEQPPSESFLLLLPATVKGFGFHDKNWRTLQVSSMKDVTWNEQAFERLVLKHNKKELIEALVTVHLENNAMSDVVEGKGAGLILLLHGPPGTGKTLTAESVAELAKKPLYRITCGDMGTDPESVEKYLESALHIGTMWECVVLLDEADVFLEERTQTDLIRNALVSVFLRVLEYYEGILILTSNRVGSFDEAFKSRMQLAIQYPELGFQERKSIWSNFIDTLEKSGVDMKASELRRDLDRLAQHRFNGRQIRNLIKTARQLAAHRNKEKLQAKHLDHVIEVANEFEEYIVRTKGVTDDEKARRLHVRAP